MVEEDTTFDSEMAHTTEPVAFLAIEGDGVLNGRSASASLWESSYRRSDKDLESDNRVFAIALG